MEVVQEVRVPCSMLALGVRSGALACAVGKAGVSAGSSVAPAVSRLAGGLFPSAGLESGVVGPPPCVTSSVLLLHLPCGAKWNGGALWGRGCLWLWWGCRIHLTAPLTLNLQSKKSKNKNKKMNIN